MALKEPLTRSGSFLYHTRDGFGLSRTAWRIIAGGQRRPVFLYAPNVSAASFMLARMDTPKGQRFSQAPQATHSPALWGSAA